MVPLFELEEGSSTCFGAASGGGFGLFQNGILVDSRKKKSLNYRINWT